MEHKTLLRVLSPQLQALVEAQLGEKLPVKQAVASKSILTTAVDDEKASPPEAKATAAAMKQPPLSAPSAVVILPPKKLNPSELYVLREPASPGYVVKENFLGTNSAMQVHAALQQLSESATFHQAAVGHGSNKREELSVRGDRIHWLQRPQDLKASTAYDPSILLLMRKMESLVFGIKNAIPELDLRNITSTQLAIFPGDGARFVKHTDTYSTIHEQARSDSGTGQDKLVRLITCVYYLNPEWTTDHGGCLRVTTKGTTSHWDIPPMLDTLVVFRSTDVEHEVLPTFHDRMALTIWYYGPPPRPRPTTSMAAAPILPSAIESFLTRPPTLTQDRIFVAIPSYRDSECRHTVDALLQKASCADRITIGICLQVDDDDDTQEYLEAKYDTTRVRIKRVHYREAAGPCVARAIAQSLWRGEGFYLQIDSHMRVRPGWDACLLDELRQCPSTKPILTTYPLGYTLPDTLSEDTRPTLLCASNFDGDGMLRQSSKTLARKSEGPLPSLLWAAGFAFSSANVVRDVPYDASLRYLFFGEEASMSVRLWTSGWDFFTPSEMIIYHLWTRAYRPVFQELESEDTRAARMQSLTTVHDQLLGRASESTLGTARTLAKYQQHIGVDFGAQTIEWRAQWGGLDPIQFDLSLAK